VTTLATVLRDRGSEILAGWIVRYERSALRFQRSTKAATHTARVASLVEALTAALAPSEPGVDESPDSLLRPGSDATRELERGAAFLGAQFASEGATGFDVAALLLELRDVLASLATPTDAAVLTRLFEWLTVIALDGFAAAGLQSLREQTSEQLEAGTPVIELLPKVPALLLVGAPNASVLDNLFARAWMLAVGTGAASLIVDCGGLADTGEAGLRVFERGYRSFVDQAKGSALVVLLTGARRPVRELVERLSRDAGVAVEVVERIDSAVTRAIERAGSLLMRRL